jgi:hypothetical protein
MMLWAAALKVKAHPTFLRPRNFVFRMPATDFIPPNRSRMRFRMRWLAV